LRTEPSRDSCEPFLCVWVIIRSDLSPILEEKSARTRAFLCGESCPSEASVLDQGQPATQTENLPAEVCSILNSRFPVVLLLGDFAQPYGELRHGVEPLC
jgi:hypothetical protein